MRCFIQGTEMAWKVVHIESVVRACSRKLISQCLLISSVWRSVVVLWSMETIEATSNQQQ